MRIDKKTVQGLSHGAERRGRKHRAEGQNPINGKLKLLL